MLATVAACDSQGSPTGNPTCTGDKCDDPGASDDVCRTDDRYGDGTCDTDCAQPDLDCFLEFDDQAAAAQWFDGFEAAQAAAQVRPPRGRVDTSDPRFVHMRELLDQGWAAYSKVIPVGMLDRAPELVVIDNPTPNAFMALDVTSNHVAWVVMVQSGLIDLGAPDADVLGVVMHELTHGVALHVIPGTSDKLRTHYQVLPGSPEPLGKDQTDDPAARAAVAAWRDLGSEAGAFPYQELNGIPTGGAVLKILLDAAVAQASAQSPDACAGALAAKQALGEFGAAHVSPLDSLLHVTSDEERAQLSQLSQAYVDELRQSCLAASDLDFVHLAAQHFGITPEQVEAGLTPEDHALIDGKPVTDQIIALTQDRYQKMRDLASMVESNTGGDLTTLRYFSFEEDADDHTVPVMAAAGFAPDALADFFVRFFLPGDFSQQCQGILDGGQVPPYGDLVDEHHGTCFRAFHLHALAAAQSGDGSGSYLARRRDRSLDPAVLIQHLEQARAYRRVAGQRLPHFHLPGDDVTYALPTR